MNKGSIISASVFVSTLLLQSTSKFKIIDVKNESLKNNLDKYGGTYRFISASSFIYFTSIKGHPNRLKPFFITLAAIKGFSLFLNSQFK